MNQLIYVTPTLSNHLDEHSIDIVVDGFTACPLDPKKQISIAIFQDEIRVLVWCDNNPDPFTIIIPKQGKIAVKENVRFNGAHTDNKTLPLNQADIDQKKNLDGFSLTSPKNEGENQ